MLILLIFFHLISSTDDCVQRTATFRDHGPDNQDNYYFVPETFRAGKQGLTKELCDIDRDDFQTLINNQFPCNGTHCRSEIGIDREAVIVISWGYYQTTQIIPVNHNLTELQGCPINIIGNLIMSYGRWGQQLGDGYYTERRLIYGDLVRQAYQTIYWCCRERIAYSILLPDCSRLSSQEPIDEIVLPILLVGAILMMMLSLGSFIMRIRR